MIRYKLSMQSSSLTTELIGHMTKQVRLLKFTGGSFMHLVRPIFVSFSALALGYGAPVFAKVAPLRLAKSTEAPNCDVNGKKHHYRSKESCEKKKGKWLGDDVTSGKSSGTGAAVGTSTTTSTVPASGTTTTSGASGTK